MKNLSVLTLHRWGLVLCLVAIGTLLIRLAFIGAYYHTSGIIIRNQAVQLQRLQEELAAEKKARQDALVRLERAKSKNLIIPRNTVWCDTGESPEELKHYIRAMEKRLKAYEDAYPEPASVKSGARKE